MTFTYADIAKMIDHSLLHPTMTDQELEDGCRLAATDREGLAGRLEQLAKQVGNIGAFRVRTQLEHLTKLPSIASLAGLLEP